MESISTDWTYEAFVKLMEESARYHGLWNPDSRFYNSVIYQEACYRKIAKDITPFRPLTIQEEVKNMLNQKLHLYTIRMLGCQQMKKIKKTSNAYSQTTPQKKSPTAKTFNKYNQPSTSSQRAIGAGPVAGTNGGIRPKPKVTRKTNQPVLSTTEKWLVGQIREIVDIRLQNTTL